MRQGDWEGTGRAYKEGEANLPDFPSLPRAAKASWQVLINENYKQQTP
jgi:hypothetical protein